MQFLVVYEEEGLTPPPPLYAKQKLHLFLPAFHSAVEIGDWRVASG